MKELNKCIGIISYIPDNMRAKREKALYRTIETCSKLFPHIDIIIIAQNWHGYNVSSDNNKITVYSYKDRLGIMDARKKLRDVFIKSNYDYLIMLDDDSNINGNAGDLYLKQIDDHPNMAGWFTYNLLTLFAISKDLFNKVDYPNVRTEDGYFDDEFIYGVLNTKYRDLMFQFTDTGLTEKTLGQPGMPSTWWNNTYNITDIQNRTKELVKRYVNNN